MQGYFISGSVEEWSEPDLSVLGSQRPAVPSVPLDVLPQPWRGWIADTAAASGSPADYVLQSVLAGLAGICGAGMHVRVTPTWSEPLVLWHAAVGEPSTGKSTALAPMRKLLGVIEAERRLHDEERRQLQEVQGKSEEREPFVASQIFLTSGDLGAAAEAISGNPRGVLQWSDGHATWLGEEGLDGHERAAWVEGWTAGPVTLERARKPARHLKYFAVSILQGIRPDRLKAALQEGDESIAARFLYAWPGPQPYRALTSAVSPDDEEVLKRLRHLSLLARTPEDPCELRFDERGVKALDAVLAAAHADRSKAEGLEAAWLGKAGAVIVRLAGALELLGLDGASRAARPGAIGSEQVKAAATLWRDYFRPHARAVFDNAVLSLHQHRVRRAARWLKENGAPVVSREDIRRHALSMSATADDTDQVLYRLRHLGFVRPDLAARQGQPGRPSNRWQVNPALAES